LLLSTQRNIVQLTGAQALIRSLEQEGVDTIFGLPGGAILPVYDPLIDSTIRHILVRHEQGAGHMAEGYALATGRPGVAMVTSGPGATNIVTPIGNAHMDSTPLVVITGQVATSSIGTDAFQECDITGITMGITKHNFLVQSAQEIPRAVAAAFHLATTGRLGPVLIDVPKDVTQSMMDWWYPATIEEFDLPGYRPEVVLDADAIARAVALIAQSERPVLYVGGGTLKSHAAKELLEFAERTGMPVVTTLMARGAFPDSHPQHLGMPGMHGMYSAVTAIQKSDLLISLGARFDDRVTGKIPAFAAGAKVIHVDIDKAEFNKVRQADVAIRGGGPSAPGRPSSRSSTTHPRPTGHCAPSTSLRRSPPRPRPGPSLPPGWASTRCGPRSTGSSKSPAPGSTPGAPARWVSACPRRSAPRSAARSARCGASTATAASR
jgi:acetolactate synthase-1/2/3 large subunit